jgi:hypothetical protein
LKKRDGAGRGGESFSRGEAGRGRKIKTRGGPGRGGESFFRDGARRGVKNHPRFGLCHRYSLNPFKSDFFKSKTIFSELNKICLVRTFHLIKRDYNEFLIYFKDVNYNAICGSEYSRETASTMSQLSEKSLSFELIEVRKYICQIKLKFFLVFNNIYL